MSDELETREVSYDWEAELPSGLWPIGYRTLKMRTTVLARGFSKGDGDSETFVVRNVIRTIRHDVAPEDWREPETPRGVDLAR